MLAATNLNYIVYFQERIKESLASEGDENLPALLDKYSHFIKSTIALKDDKGFFEIGSKSELFSDGQLSYTQAKTESGDRSSNVII